MATFDGDPLYVGDKLFDIVDGIVTVVQIYDDRILLQVGGRATRTKPYSYNGIAARRSSRTLYWHDPRVVVPRKDAHVWTAQKSLLQDYTKRFGDIVSSAKYVEDHDENNSADIRRLRGVGHA